MAKIAVLGFGTVGGGVARVLEEDRTAIAARLGEEVSLKRILVRHFRESPWRDRMTDRLEDITGDPEIAVVVEVIGGVDAAYDYTRRCLMSGKHVVTANKQLVAERGRELLELAEAHNVQYLFEASVGGGIPLLHPLVNCLGANEIQEVYGILNGTTNYILTQMTENGESFDTALKAAQEKGYAEADPTADVAGIDAGRKTCILADLAFGHETPPEKVPMEGITALDLRDVAIARQAGFRVKLLGRTLRLPDGGYAAYVAPHLIPEGKPMAHVSGVFNAAVIRGSAVGETMFYGPGAGAYPTASACVSDVMNVLAGPAPFRFRWEAPEGLRDAGEVVSRWYLRTDGDAPAVRAAFPQAEALTEGAFLTGPLTGFALEERCRSLPVLARYRVLD